MLEGLEKKNIKAVRGGWYKTSGYPTVKGLMPGFWLINQTKKITFQGTGVFCLLPVTFGTL